MVEWAPLWVPFERRLQTAAVLLLISSMFIAFLATVFLPFTPLVVLVVPYFLWVFIDRKTPSNGGRSDFLVRSFRRITKRWFIEFARYFPAKLYFNDCPDDSEASSKLFDASKRYMFAVHPHGFMYVLLSFFFLSSCLSNSYLQLFRLSFSFHSGTSAWAGILAEGLNITRRLGGLNFRAVTLASNFILPFWRDFLLLQGLCDCSEKSIRSIFDHARSVVIVPGGARESLYARPTDRIQLVLKTRKGFVRIAITSGAALVPVFAFGENDLYHQADNTEGSLVRRIQDLVLRYTGVGFPLVRGRGIFNYSLGMLPHRHPLNIVVGNPIPVPLIAEPTEEDVTRIHEEYKARLMELFETHKHRFSPSSTLEFI